MQLLPVEPTEHEVNLAESSGRVLATLVGGTADGRVIRVVDEEVCVPASALRLLVEILGHMAAGRAVTILPVDAELTTQQAADLLNVSRPHLVKMLEQGDLPFHKVGTRRRIRLHDLLGYQNAHRARQRTALAELTREAQDLGLYD